MSQCRIDRRLWAVVPANGQGQSVSVGAGGQSRPLGRPESKRGDAGYLAAAVGWGPTFALGGALAAGAGLAALALRPPEGSGLAAGAD